MPLIPSVTPEGLRVIALLLVGMSALAIAVHVLMLAVAARRAALSPRAQAAVPLVGAVLLALWFGWAEGAALYHAAIPPPPPGDLRPAIPVLLAMLGFVVAGTLVLYGSRTMRSVNAAMPSWWLIAAQTYRVAGLMFIWPFMAVGDLPAGFALPAGIGDFLVGAAAPFVAAAVARRRPNARRLATIWNWVGLADLIVAPAAAVLTQAPVVSIYPLGLVPLFLGPPLGILTHIASLRNLAVAGKDRASDAGIATPRATFPVSA